MGISKSKKNWIYINKFPGFLKNKLIINSRWWFLFLLVVSVLFISCSNSTGHHTIDTLKNDYKDTIHRKPPSSFSDTIIIDFPTAVFYNPDSLQLEKIKANTDTMVFESIMHDCFYQMKYSRNVLQQNWTKIKIVEIRNVRYILFKPENGRNECIDLNTQNDPCGIIIFNGRKKAQLVDMTNIDTQLGFYFSD